MGFSDWNPTGLSRPAQVRPRPGGIPLPRVSAIDKMGSLKHSGALGIAVMTGVFGCRETAGVSFAPEEES